MNLSDPSSLSDPLQDSSKGSKDSVAHERHESVNSYLDNIMHNGPQDAQYNDQDMNHSQNPNQNYSDNQNINQPDIQHQFQYQGQKLYKQVSSHSSGTVLGAGRNMFQNVGSSIHSSFQNYFTNSDGPGKHGKDGFNRKNSSFRKRDILICLLCFIALVFALYSGSNVQLAPLLHFSNVKGTFDKEFGAFVNNFNMNDQENVNNIQRNDVNNELQDNLKINFQDNLQDINSNNIPKSSQQNILNHWGSMTHIATSPNYMCFYDSKHLILMKKDLIRSWKSYKSQFTNVDSFNEGFFRWVQKMYPDGYTVYRANVESSEKAKTKYGDSTVVADIASISLSDNNLLVFFDNWSLELYQIDTSVESLQLKQMWSQSIQKKLQKRWKKRNKNSVLEFIVGKPREIVVSFLDAHKVHTNDKGLIVIGARRKNYLRTLTMEDILDRGHELDESSIIVSYQNVDDIENDTSDSRDITSVDGHYSYYGIELFSGEIRWKHENDDFQYSHTEHLYPQHNFKVDADQHLAHSGEVHWRNYLEDIISKATPHVYRHEKDTKIIPAHFKPSVKRHGQKSSILDNRKQYGDIGDRFQNVISSYKELKHEKSTKNAEFPNVLIVHMSRGIEVIHIYTGRTLCQVTPLKKNVAYGNLNFDGSINAAQSVVKSRNILKGDVNDCIAEIESGSKGNSEIVFQTSVCRIQSGWKKFGISRLLQQDNQPVEGTSSPMVTTPAILERYDGLSFKIVKDVVFLASNGLATCLTTDNNGKWKLKWQVETMSGWPTNDVDPTNPSKSFFPQVSSYRMRESDRDSSTILVGREFLTILDIHGKVQQIMSLPDAPVISPIQFVDVDEDGLLDVQIETEDGIYIYSSKRRAGTSVLSFILIILAIVLSAMYFSTNVSLDDPSFVKSKEFSD